MSTKFSLNQFISGQTFREPMTCSLHLGEIFQANQGYVMCGRAQTINQVFIPDTPPLNGLNAMGRCPWRPSTYYFVCDLYKHSGTGLCKIHGGVFEI